MILTHASFKRSQAIPGVDTPRPGPVLGIVAYALDFGPELIGPIPVVIAESEDENNPGLIILAGESPYWFTEKGNDQGWYQSGYYLRFFPVGTKVRFAHVTEPSR